MISECPKKAEKHGLIYAIYIVHGFFCTRVPRPTDILLRNRALTRYL